MKLDEANFDVSSLLCHDCCDIFKKNPALVAKHFKYRVKFF